MVRAYLLFVIVMTFLEADSCYTWTDGRSEAGTAQGVFTGTATQARADQARKAKSIHHDRAFQVSYEASQASHIQDATTTA